LAEQSQELDEPQQAALAALRAGQSFAQAGTLAGVHRATVFRWVKRNPYFAAPAKAPTMAPLPQGAADAPFADNNPEFLP